MNEQHLKLTELYGEGFSLFSTFPVLSPLAARGVGWDRLERWSRRFEFREHTGGRPCVRDM